MKKAQSSAELCAFLERQNYSLVLPAALLAAHLALSFSESDLLPAGVIFLLFGFSPESAGTVTVFFAMRLATPARMFATPCGLSFHFFLRPAFGAAAAIGASDCAGVPSS